MIEKGDIEKINCLIDLRFAREQLKESTKEWEEKLKSAENFGFFIIGLCIGIGGMGIAKLLTL